MSLFYFTELIKMLQRVPLNLSGNLHGAIAKCLPKVQQFRFVHHHKELDEPGGYLRFIGWHRSNRGKANRNTRANELKFAKLRGRKRLLIELEDEVEKREMEALPGDQLRLYLLRKGKPDIYENIQPRKWEEHQIMYQSFNTIIDTYIPPEKSIFSRVVNDKTAVFSDIKEYGISKWHNLIGYGERRIRKKEGLEKFSRNDFPKEAEQIYISAFKALMDRDRRKLHGLITETAFMKLWPDVERGTLRWELVRFNEPSRVVGIRAMDMPLKSGNDIAQVTVRMHSTQKMALYDKDGHLLVGSEEEPREVLEYVVFENHISSELGKWRFHDKLNPHWLKPKQPIVRTALIEENKAKNKTPYEPHRLHSGMAERIKEGQKEK